MYIAIFTMKIILLLALASVGLCNDFVGSNQPPIIIHGAGGSGWGGSGVTGSSSSGLLTWASGSDTYQCNPSKNENANDPKCLENALQTLPQISYIAHEIFCSYLNNKENNTDAYYKELKEATSFFGGCIGCELGYPFGLSGPLGNAGSGVGGMAADLLILDTIEGALGLEEPLHDLICILLNPATVTDCVVKLVGEDPSEVTDDVKTLLCQDEAKLDVTMTLTTLIGAGCLKNVAITGNVLNNLNGNSALPPALTGFVDDIKKTPSGKGFISELSCGVGRVGDDLGLSLGSG